MKRLFLIIGAAILITFMLIFRKPIKQEAENLLMVLVGKNAPELECLDSIPSQGIFYYSDSIRIVGDLYLPFERERAPFILLLHGSSVHGRKSPLIQILADQFRQLNYVLLAIDLRGYGESQDPRAVTSPDDFDFAQDAINAISFVFSEVEIDTSRVFVIGHSFGAGVALAAQANDKRIKKIVLIGPPRRLRERFLNEDASDIDYFLKRWQSDMKLPYSLKYSIVRDVYEELDIETYREIFTKPDHIPLFLIDGEKEDERDLEFLRKVYRELSPPVEYWTVDDTGHYMRTRFSNGKVCYDRVTIQHFIQRVDEWLGQPSR